MAISLVDSKNGNIATTTLTVTLPTYTLSEYIVLILSSNQTFTRTFSSNVTATVISSANAGSRLTAYKIVPVDGSQTSFTITVGTSSFFTYWIASYSGVDTAAAIDGVGNNIGNSATSAIEIPAVPLTGYVATGNEVAIWAGGTNSSATWTTTAETLFSTGTSTNAALLVNSGNVTAGVLTATFSNVDRGLNGTSRNESALAIVLQPTDNNPTVNLLTNPSFEDVNSVSMGWEVEDNAVGAPAYTKLSTGAVDGTRRQQMEYAGQAGDEGKFFAIYQSPIDAEPGDVFTFSVFLSGSKSNASLIIGIEGFSAGMVYISEHDTTVSSLTSTMTEYTVEYTCPANTVAVAVYIQANELQPTTSITVQMDKAILTKEVSTTTGQIKVYDGSSFVAKPVKVWNGSAWVTMPVKRWNGTSWITTPY